MCCPAPHQPDSTCKAISSGSLHSIEHTHRSLDNQTCRYSSQPCHVSYLVSACLCLGSQNGLEAAHASVAKASLDIPITKCTADTANSSDLQPVHSTRSACSTLHRVSPTTPGRQHSVKQRLPTVESTYLVAYWNVGCCTNGLALVHKVLLFLTYPGSLTGVQGRFWLQMLFLPCPQQVWT